MRAATLVRPPRAPLSQLAQAGGAVRRALALNIAFLYVTRTVQRLDTTGTAAAAHAVTIQLWQLGGVVLFALSTVASILVPTELKREGAATRRARHRLALPRVGRRAGRRARRRAARGAADLHLFAPSAEVRAAAVVPSVIGAFLKLINGVTFIGEGVMVPGSFGALAAGQVVATLALLVSLTRAATPGCGSSSGSSLNAPRERAPPPLCGGAARREGESIMVFMHERPRRLQQNSSNALSSTESIACTFMCVALTTVTRV